MAPAATVRLFDETLKPLLSGPSPRLKQYNQWHLSETLEQADSSMRPLLLYGRSLLYLVSEAFEELRPMPLLGMQKHYEAMSRLPNMQAWASEGAETRATRHGDFDDDDATRTSVIQRILASK